MICIECSKPSLFTHNMSIQPPESGDPIVPHKLSVSSTPNSTDTPDINKELNTYKARLALELNNFKKQLETQSRIEVECAKQNLKSEFDHELRHQTLTQTETINTEAADRSVGHAVVTTADSHPTHMLSVTTSTSISGYNPASPTTPTSFQSKYFNNKSSLVEVMDVLNRSMD